MADRSLFLPISVIGVGALALLMKKGGEDDDSGAEAVSDFDPNLIRDIEPSEVAFSADGSVKREGSSWRIRVLDKFLDERRQAGSLATKQNSQSWWWTNLVERPITFIGSMFSDEQETQQKVGTAIYGFLWLAAGLGIGSRIFRKAVKDPGFTITQLHAPAPAPPPVIFAPSLGGAPAPASTALLSVWEVRAGRLQFTAMMQKHFLLIEQQAAADAAAAGTALIPVTTYEAYGKTFEESMKYGGERWSKAYFKYLADQGGIWGKEKVSSLSAKQGVATLAGLVAAGAVMSHEDPNIAASALDAFLDFTETNSAFLGSTKEKIADLPQTPTVLEFNKEIMDYILKFQMRTF